MPETVTETPTETPTASGYVPFPGVEYHWHDKLKSALLELHIDGGTLTGDNWNQILELVNEATTEAWCRGYRIGFCRGEGKRAY